MYATTFYGELFSWELPVEPVLWQGSLLDCDALEPDDVGGDCGSVASGDSAS
jgi:hypothetical protein